MNKGVNKPKELSTNPPKFLTVEEVAAMLRIKARTVYEMVSQNRIPFRKAGRRTVFLLEEILDWTTPRQRINGPPFTYHFHISRPSLKSRGNIRPLQTRGCNSGREQYVRKKTRRSLALRLHD